MSIYYVYQDLIKCKVVWMQIMIHSTYIHISVSDWVGIYYLRGVWLSGDSMYQHSSTTEAQSSSSSIVATTTNIIITIVSSNSSTTATTLLSTTKWALCIHILWIAICMSFDFRSISVNSITFICSVNVFLWRFHISTAAISFIQWIFDKNRSVSIHCGYL